MMAIKTVPKTVFKIPKFSRFLTAPTPPPPSEETWSDVLQTIIMLAVSLRPPILASGGLDGEIKDLLAVLHFK